MVFITIYKPLARQKKGTLKENCHPSRSKKGKNDHRLLQAWRQVFLLHDFKKIAFFMLSVSIMWCPKTASSGKYQDTQHGTILIQFGSFLTMNMVLICETQKASFVLLKVAFHMLNEVEDFNWIRTLTSHFFFFYHDGINTTAACRPFSNDLSQLQSLLNDHGFSKANPFY